MEVSRQSGIAAGRESGRTSEREIYVFDSTGIGLQDVAACAAVFEAAVAAQAAGEPITAVKLSS